MHANLKASMPQDALNINSQAWYSHNSKTPINPMVVLH